eukprot:713993_1
MDNTTHDSDLTRLFAAIESKDIEAIQNLLSSGLVDVNESDDKGRTALHVAAGNADIVRLLLEDPNIDVNKPDGEGTPPLVLAAFKGFTEVVRLLLGSTNIDVNKEDVLGTMSFDPVERAYGCDNIPLVLAAEK